MKKLGVFLLGLVIGIGLMIWFFSPVIADALSSWGILTAPKKGFDYSTRGQFGDSFGFATSLFSFLSFLGVLGVFALQRKHADAREKPFVIASMEGQTSPLKISLGNDKDGFQLTIKYGINNYSEYLAHTCHFEYTFIGEGGKNISQPGKIRYTPLIRRDIDEIIEYSWFCSIKDYNWLLDQISRHSLAMLHIRLTYRNSNGITYHNTCNFNVSIDNPSDLAAINDLRAGKRDAASWGGGKIVILAVKEEDPFLTAD